jgi:hypothetical protein
MEPTNLLESSLQRAIRANRGSSDSIAGWSVSGLQAKAATRAINLTTALSEAPVESLMHALAGGNVPSGVFGIWGPELSQPRSEIGLAPVPAGPPGSPVSMLPEVGDTSSFGGNSARVSSRAVPLPPGVGQRFFIEGVVTRIHRPKPKIGQVA